MGTIKIGKTEYEGDTIILSERKLFLGNKTVYLEDIEGCVQLKFKESKIRNLQSEYETVVKGNIGKIRECNNLCVWGNDLRPIYHNSKFYSNTGMEEYKKAKANLTRKLDCPRTIIHCSGDFSIVAVYECMFSVEVFVEGSIADCRCAKDILCRGSVDLSNSENVYITNWGKR